MNTEKKILEAAEKEFLEKGFSRARTISIAEAAGVTHAMLHYYFRTKEKLFEKILLEKVSCLREIMLGPLVDEKLPFFDKIKYIVESHLDFLEANPELPRFLLTVLTERPECLAPFDLLGKNDGRTIVEIVQEEIDRNAKDGICKQVDARMLILDIVSLNVFLFLGFPMIDRLIGPLEVDKEFIDARKRNNVELIMRKLK